MQQAPAAASGFAPAPRAEGNAPAAAPDALDTAGTWADSSDKKLEHVNDFFAPDTLGFTNDGSHIETAGPGRLTILGFVPKSSGSIKTTLLAMVVLFVAAGGFIGYQVWHSDIIKKTNQLYGDAKAALVDDQFFRYQEALKLADQMLELDGSQGLAFGVQAYAHSVLALEHLQPDSLAKAKTALAKANKNLEKPNQFTAAAAGMIAFLEDRYEEGIASLAEIMDMGASHVLIDMENYRLRNATKPDDKETAQAFARLVQLASGEPRALNFLGWHYYGEENYTRADASFDTAAKNSRNHPRASVGKALVDLDRGIGLDERQKEVQKLIDKVLALPAEDRSNRDTALAHFAQAQLNQWQKKPDEAKEHYEKAYSLDPENPLFDYRRGLQLLGQGESKDAVEFLKKAAAKASNSARVVKKLVSAQLGMGDTDGAEGSLKRAKEMAPDDSELKLLEGELLRRRKNFKEALALYKSVDRKEDGGNAFALAQIGLAASHREGGNGAKAVAFMTEFLGNVPGGVSKQTQAKLWEELGLSHLAIRDQDSAKQAFEACIDVYSVYPDCHCRLADAIGRGGEAIEAAKRCERLDPRNPLLNSVSNLLR